MLRLTIFTFCSFVAFFQVQSFQVKEVDSVKADDHCDSDEYDEFYN